MRKPPPKKRVARGAKPRTNVDPTRMAIQALERIQTVLVKSGYGDRLGPAMTLKELSVQAEILGMELPPSYVAAMRVASRIGDPEVFLASGEMAQEAIGIRAQGSEEAKRYAPFCRREATLICFDRGAGRRAAGNPRHPGELPIIEWEDGNANPLAAHFGEWLDMVADAREESVESAAKMPQRLKRLLYELGFRFEYPVVGRLETGDAEAIVELIGADLARTVRGDVDRLFDSSGKASLTLNVDEFTLAVSLRTGIFVFEAEDVFRWLRYFRDENFFGESAREPGHPDEVRDLRRAPREAPLVQRGVMHLAQMPSSSLLFRAASGTSSNDFWVLGRTAATRERATSLLVHIVDGSVAATEEVGEALNDIYVARDGATWGLTTTHAVCIRDGRVESFPLRRPTRGRPWWYGIGGVGERVLVWGMGALLEFDGDGFTPFQPDAMLDASEAVVALVSHGLRLSLLVVGDRVGAVARFDSVQWQAVTEDQVIEGALLDLDVWRRMAYVLDRDGQVWRVDQGPPTPVDLPTRHQAFLTETGTRRPLTSVRAYDHGLLLASHGGVVSTSSTGDPLFHAASGDRDPVRLVRLGGLNAVAEPESAAAGREMGIVALAGSSVWLWKGGAFSVLDMREL